VIESLAGPPLGVKTGQVQRVLVAAGDGLAAAVTTEERSLVELAP
jgi:hypothetical protein